MTSSTGVYAASGEKESPVDSGFGRLRPWRTNVDGRCTHPSKMCDEPGVARVDAQCVSCKDGNWLRLCEYHGERANVALTTGHYECIGCGGRNSIARFWDVGPWGEDPVERDARFEQKFSEDEARRERIRNNQRKR